MKLNEYLMANREPGEKYALVPRIHCKDGFNISVQANRGAYCSPREDDGPWFCVELGYPSADPGPEFSEYREDKENPTDTVYGYVPIELVAKLIESHGGHETKQEGGGV